MAVQELTMVAVKLSKGWDRLIIVNAQYLIMLDYLKCERIVL